MAVDQFDFPTAVESLWPARRRRLHHGHSGGSRQLEKGGIEATSIDCEGCVACGVMHLTGVCRSPLGPNHRILADSRVCDHIPRVDLIEKIPYDGRQGFSDVWSRKRALFDDDHSVTQTSEPGGEC